MNSDLIVMTFDGSEMAQTVHRALQAMRRSHVLGLTDSAIITKNGDEPVKLHQGIQAGTGSTAFLAGLVFRSPESTSSAFAGVKLDDEFVDTVVSALHSTGSALFFFLDSDGLSDSCELLDALARFRGTVHQTTLPPESEALLQKMRVLNDREHSE